MTQELAQGIVSLLAIMIPIMLIVIAIEIGTLSNMLRQTRDNLQMLLYELIEHEKSELRMKKGGE